MIMYYRLNKVKDINMKRRTYYFFNDIIDMENFGFSNIKIDEKLYENILIYYIRYVMIKEYIKIYSVNHLYLILIYANDGNKYLTLVSTNESKEKIKNI